LALHFLDRLEGVDEQPPLYERVRVSAVTARGPLECWTYLYARLERLTAAGATRVAGAWAGSDGA
ncbi:MAG TPA: gamma-glutamylcyclotransferase, partial [Deinococcales bacterium]|nr:gamma-glutamylcyclotransferase [Deinococcales bacterium]